MLLPATPGWVPLPVVLCRSLPLLAGARRLWWCVLRVGVSFVVCVCGVCGRARWPCCVVFCVFVVSALLVVWCGWCGGCVFPVCRCVWLRVCGVPVVCGLVSPPLASPRRWPWAWFPATPGWGPLVVVVGPGCPSPWSWCVCVRCVALSVGVGGVGGSCAVWLPCVCVCVLAVCGWWGVSNLGWFSSSVVGMVQKAEEEVRRKN